VVANRTIALVSAAASTLWKAGSAARFDSGEEIWK
jgi:hypothetical protein